MTAAVEEPPTDPAPVLTAKLERLAQTNPDVYQQLFTTKDPKNA